jgi:hypothetical protein
MILRDFWTILSFVLEIGMSGWFFVTIKGTESLRNWKQPLFLRRKQQMGEL